MRIPIDQIFCSSNFRLIGIERMPAMGSDHFPIFVQLALTTATHNPERLAMEQPNKKDWQLSNERITEGLAVVSKS